MLYLYYFSWGMLGHPLDFNGFILYAYQAQLMYPERHLEKI